MLIASVQKQISMRRILAICILISSVIPSNAQSIVSDKASANHYLLINKNSIAPIYVDSNEAALVLRSAVLLQSDIEMVTGIKPSIIHKLDKPYNNIICIGTQVSSLIKELIQKKKISLTNINNKWEAYSIGNILNPFNKVNNILVIAGSDRRGVAYGVFEFSKQIGVSPWYWWADVPVKKKTSLYISIKAKITDQPKVKYRGIFINDEAPALSNWSRSTFGGFNHKFYTKVFELMLRLKANYLWPAMWGNAFYADDSLNIKAAEEYGIVIGTSHHEPLMRAHDEWRRFGKGKWNYDSNAVQLQHFWKEGMQRATNEKIVSIGMRGDGDEPMTRETATALLERIVKDQRQIIETVTGKSADQTPQLWALYKEVQDYYDKGMRVPDDVTLLLCDDNWGNIRRLPKPNEVKRKGGYGIYYHFDYVGGPRNYKWLNTNNLARVWEQMHLAWEYDARQIWIVNVGDIKPMELPISFFLDHAWDPSKFNESNISNYYSQWAAEQFDAKYSKQIGEVLRKYAQYAARRKLELIDHNTYNIIKEWPGIIRSYDELYSQAKNIGQSLPAEYHDAYYQLVLHPVEAFTNLHMMYHNIAWNRYHAKEKWISANEWADAAKEKYLQDSLITVKYHQLNNGKWNHMMSQTHIGYTYWQQPPVNKMPAVVYVAKDTATNPPVAIDYVVRDAKGLIPPSAKGNVFYQWDNYVSIQAENWSRNINNGKIKLKTISGIGKDGSGITVFPVTASGSSASVEYDFYCYNAGNINLLLYSSPTLNLANSKEGLRFLVSIDDQKPVPVSLNNKDADVRTWSKWVADNIIIDTVKLTIAKPGKHIIKYRAIDPGIVLQKIVADFGGLDKFYLAPPETILKR